MNEAITSDPEDVRCRELAEEFMRTSMREGEVEQALAMLLKKAREEAWTQSRRELRESMDEIMDQFNGAYDSLPE